MGMRRLLRVILRIHPRSVCSNALSNLGMHGNPHVTEGSFPSGEAGTVGRLSLRFNPIRISAALRLRAIFPAHESTEARPKRVGMAVWGNRSETNLPP